MSKNITILKGGPGSEREVSLRSAMCVARALRERGFEVAEMDVTSADFTPPDGIGFVFNLIHGTFGEDGALQAILDARGISYTGEGAAGSRLAFDKILTKRRFNERGIPTASFEVIPSGALPSFALPMVIKAPCQGSSVGVHIVRTREQIAPALADVAKYGSEILVEEFVQGRELTVGILGDQSLPVIEICPKEGFYDFKNKYPWLSPGGAADHFCPAHLTEDEASAVREMALAAHRALDLEVYSRVDFLLPETGGPSVLEINTIPGMTDSSLLPEAAGVVGISFGELCERIIELSRRKK